VHVRPLQLATFTSHPVIGTSLATCSLVRLVLRAHWAGTSTRERGREKEIHSHVHSRDSSLYTAISLTVLVGLLTRKVLRLRVRCSRVHVTDSDVYVRFCLYFGRAEFRVSDLLLVVKSSYTVIFRSPVWRMKYISVLFNVLSVLCCSRGITMPHV